MSNSEESEACYDDIMRVIERKKINCTSLISEFNAKLFIRKEGEINFEQFRIKRNKKGKMLVNISDKKKLSIVLYDNYYCLYVVHSSFHDKICTVP